ncbi:MAG: hypothetical protein RL748_984 [Pseudomonadota bacterium]|jgi:hypothetical protein
MFITLRRFCIILIGLIGPGSLILPAQAHEGHQHASAGSSAKPRPVNKHLGLSASITPDGTLWTASVETGSAGEHVVLRHSTDSGKSWSPSRRVNLTPEPIAAKGEDIPKLAFGQQGQALVIWTRNGAKNHSGDVRYSYSADGGKSWSLPATLQQDQQPIAHRYANLVADPAGRFYISWIDQRDAINTRAEGKSYRASALYYSVSQDGGKSWRSDSKLADHSCECCRLAMALDSDGRPLVFWRQSFEQERDHALVKLDPDGNSAPFTRATFDGWKTESCPHQGPGLAVANGQRHAVWFNMVGNSGKVFYGRLNNGRVEGQLALPEQAEHATIAAVGDKVWLAWNSFDGKNNIIGGMHSSDGGQHWSQATRLASSKLGVDQPRLLTQGNSALLLWNTESGLVLKTLP